VFVLPGRWADPTDPNRPAAPGDTNAIWIDGDYHLTAGSPCIDAGDPNLTAHWGPYDIDGQWRPVPALADIGCDELGTKGPS
jgi:hypothetical protein